MPDLLESDNSLDPSTALAKQEQTAIELAGTLADFSDIAKVNAAFEKEKWSVAKKVEILVAMTKGWRKQPAQARAAMVMLDQVWKDAIARSDLSPQPNDIPPPAPGDESERLGMPSARNIESIAQTTKTIQVQFQKKEPNNGTSKKLHPPAEAGRDIIDADESTGGLGTEYEGDTETGDGDGDSELERSDEGAGETDPDSEAYYQDDREAGALHRPPAAGYGVRTGSI